MSQIDNIQQKINFLENSNEAMERIAKSENDRLQLEIQLNKLINSEQSFAKAKAVKLKAYYQKLCDEEEKSMKRNQQLLVDMQRIDSQFLQLDSKLERLTNLKKECEVYLRTAYPSWTDEKKIFSKNDPKPAPKLDYLTQINTLPKYDDKNQVLNTLISTIKMDKTKDPVTTFNNHEQGALNELIMNLSKNQLEKTVVEKRPEHKEGEDFGLKQLISSYRPLTSTVKFDDEMQKTTTMDNNLLKEYEKQLKRQESNILDTLNQTATSTVNFDLNNEILETINPFNKNGTWSTQNVNNLDEIPKASSTVKEDTNSKRSFVAILDPNEKNRQGSVRQDLSLSSLYYMLDHIEIQKTINPGRLYRHEEPHYKTKLEIIKIASEKDSLDDMDPADISMVILEQLSQVIRKQTKNKSIFTADLMSLSVADISEKMVSLFLKEEIDIRLWDRLVKHMNFLKRYASMDPVDIARKFAPKFLAFDSIAVEKAIKFLEKILTDMNESRNKTVTLDETITTKTETSLNQELLLASNSNLKESKSYQDFINSGQSGYKKVVEDDDDDDESDEDDEINELLSHKQVLSTNSTTQSENHSPKKNNYLMKSPRKIDYDFDFSQSSKSDSKIQTGIKQLNSLRSTKDKSKIPGYLKSADSDDDIESSSEISHKFKSKTKDSDSDFDFYH